MIDLPGTYSINGFSEEEKVAKNFLLNEEYDVIINVIDSTHLTRNLLLTLELLNLNKKILKFPWHILLIVYNKPILKE